MRHSKPIALVSGVSSGIGAVVAKHLADNGFRVFGTSRRPWELSSIEGVSTIALDVTDSSSVTAAVQHVLDQSGHIDVLVNNAGAGLTAAAEESSVQQALSLFDTNFFGVVRVTNEVLPHLRRQRAGRIINISSVVGFLPLPYNALYVATKHAVEGYTGALDHELREYGLRALLVEPGYIRSGFATSSWEADNPIADYASNRVAARALSAKAVGAGEGPEVVAKAVLAAATDKHPKLRYPAGHQARRLTLLKRLAPAGVLDKGIRKLSGLDHPAVPHAVGR